MGEFLFKISGRQFKEMFIGFALAAVSLFALFIVYYSTVSIWALLLLVFGVFGTWNAYNRLVKAINNEIRFYELGMKIIKGYDYYVFLVDDIKGIVMGKEFIFELKDGKTIAVNGDDYSGLEKAMKAYGARFNLDWSL